MYNLSMYTTFMGFILLVMVLSNLNKKFCFCVSVIEREHTWLVVLTTWYIFTQKVEPFLYFEKAKEFIVKILVETCCNLSWYKLLTIQKRFLGNYFLHRSKWARNGIVVWGKINTLQLLILTIFDLHPLGFAISGYYSQIQILQVLIGLEIFS